jgi:uncharacterized protein DUF5666/uncharacterized protein DUF4382
MRIFVVLLILIGAGALELGCGSSTKQPAGTPLVQLVVLGGDTPACNIASSRLTLRGAVLTPEPSSSGVGGIPVSVLLPGQAVTVDFAALQDMSTVINTISIPEGSYSQLTLTLSDPQLVVLNYNTLPPSVEAVTATLTAASVTIPFNPPLSVTSTNPVAMRLDLDLPDSILTDSNGVVTGVIQPTFTVAQIANSGMSLGEVENLHGIVQGIATSGNSSAFTGNFTILPPGLSVSALTVNTTSTTAFAGTTGLNGLAANTFVEADAFVDPSGNIVARTIQAEGLENPGESMAAFLGPIVSVTTASGNVTGFNMFVREESPDVSAILPEGQILNVELSSGSAVTVEASATNFDQLTASLAALAPGQEVVAHGPFQVSQNAGTAPTLSATEVFLREQTLTGTFSSLLAAGSDNMTGGFAFLPCADAFAGRTISVLTNAQTAFVGLSGLNSLTNSPVLRVKGLLLFEPSLTSAGTVPLTPPSYLISAEQVHQLP